MKNAVFWDVVPCRFCVNRSFGGTYRLHLQGRKIRERGTSSHLLTLVPRSRIFLPWRWRRYVLLKRRLTRDLHGATSQKSAFFLPLLIYFFCLVSWWAELMIQNIAVYFSEKSVRFYQATRCDTVMNVATWHPELLREGSYRYRRNVNERKARESQRDGVAADHEIKRVTVLKQGRTEAHGSVETTRHICLKAIANSYTIRRDADKSWLFLFSYFQHKQNVFFRWVKEVRTTKSQVCGAQGGICRVNTFFQSCSLLFSL
jgi:hypothetical protein